MIAHSAFNSPSFNLVTKGLVALHRLIKLGKDDSPEAESIRDSLDVPLKALSPTEKERAQWLSEDLYSVSEPPVAATQREMNPQAQQQLAEAIEARQRREWDRSLALLRRWRDYISPALLSYIRGSIWAQAGNLDVAAMFYGHASETDSTNANYLAIYLTALARCDPDNARRLARGILAEAERNAPVVVTQAADIRLQESRTLPEAESAQLRRELIPTLTRNMTRMEEEGELVRRVSDYALTAALLGFCNEFLGNLQAAANVYTRGLRADPDNDGLLVARGILLYGSSPRAVADFELTARRGFPLIWPYLFLAHHYLITAHFDSCRAMCEMGLRMQGSDAAKSQLEEWRAIAQAGLGFPPESIRAAFEAALRLDPANDFARHNRDIFETNLAAPHADLRPMWEQKSEAALRQFGLAERRYALAA